MLKNFIAVMLILIIFVPFGFVEATSKNTSPQKENLIDSKTSSFDGIQDLRETKWFSFYAGEISISDNGFSGSCLKMETPRDTWGSPALDIFPYIDKPGQYIFSAYVKYDGQGEKHLNFILRGTRATSIIEKFGKNYYGSICAKRIKAGQWEKFTTVFNVTEEDLKLEDHWNLCISVVEPDIEALYFDEVVLIKGAANNNATNNETVTEPSKELESNVDAEFKEKTIKEKKQLYDPVIMETAIKTVKITAIVVAVVVLIKIILPV